MNSVEYLNSAILEQEAALQPTGWSSKKSSRIRAGVALSALAALLAMPGAAFAQAAEPGAGRDGNRSVNSEDAGEADEIVVTGTLVRGIAPPGTNVIATGQADIKAAGVITTAQLLQTIPQLGSFNNLQAPTGFGNQITANRPNLRTLPGFNTAGGSTTLVLMDGHRLAGMGIVSTSPDPDVIPPGALERFEIVPDGGSAVYGSDAVAGVLNFITLKRFDGVKVAAHYGFADNYSQWDAQAIAGKTWSTGSAYVSYTYTQHDPLFGRDRDYVRQFPSETGTPGLTNLQCASGNVRIGTVYYGLPYTTATAASVAGKPNQCDLSDDATFYPREHRHSVLASFNQELGGGITADLKAFFTNRVIDITTGPFRIAQAQPQTVGTTVAGFSQHQVGAETSQAVFFQFGDANSGGQRLRLNTWGITPTLTADLGGSWQLRLLGSYSRSDTENVQRNFNTTALTNAINAGLFNVYDPASSNPAAVALITNSELYARTKQSLLDFRLVVDGELFRLPGGGVKLAAGVEYYREGFDIRTADQVVPGTELTGQAGMSLPRANAPVGASAAILPATAAIPLISLNRNVKSLFGEVVVPLFGAGNATPLLNELTVSLAGRYDDYSDVGGTFNPKIGVTYRPIDWFKIRGSWGKSFNAPSLADTPGVIVANISYSSRLPPGALLQSNGGPLPNPAAGQVAAFIQGNVPGIKPQTATTLSLGADIQPPFVPGLNLGVTYYKIDLNGVIGLPPTDAANVYGPYFDSIVTMGPFTQAEIDAAQTGLLIRNTCSPQPNCVYAIVDLRKRNLGDFKVRGFDFNASYRVETGFGAINLAGNANYELSRQRSAAAGQPFIEEPNVSHFRLRFSAGVEIGDFLAQATLNHTAGYQLTPVVGFSGTTVTGQTYTTQDRVDSFSVVNLFFRYDFKGEGLAKELQLTLNIDNLFNAAPPEYRGDPIAGQHGYVNGLTLGRLFQFGISKAF